MKLAARVTRRRLCAQLAPPSWRGHATILALWVTLIMSLAARSVHGQIPGALPTRPIALVGGHVHPVEGPDFVDGTILFDQGRIVAVGPNVSLPSEVETIDVSGKHIYPGLMNAVGQLGLVEIASIRATSDASEVGEIRPNVRVQVAVNPESELIPVTRANGVLTTLSVPQGGLISGTSAVLQLDGWTWEEMTVQAPAGMHLEWPAMAPQHAWWQDQPDAAQIAARDERLRLLEETFDKADHYRQGRRAGTIRAEHDLRWEAMLPVLERQIPLIVAAETRLQIQSAVAFAQRRQLRLIILGGYDAESCAALLREHQVPVIVRSVYRLPQRRSDPFDAPYTLPQRLHQAGIAYCIAGDERFNGPNLRNLPYHAATAVAYGLPADEGLRAVTLYPAQILGVADRLGSLVPGKHATLIVTDGNPLEITTHVTAAWIQGRPVDLENRHERLRRKYEQKYQQ